MDMASILRLLDFLEALFNGGSDFNEPLKRCLNRLTDAKWANSDILLVSGELVGADSWIRLGLPCFANAFIHLRLSAPTCSSCFDLPA